MLIKKRQGGFTVIELMIAIGLFGIVAPSVSLAIVSINQINDTSADLTLANVLAENKIESLRSAGYNSLSNGTVDFTGELSDSFTAPRQANYTISTPESGLKKIAIHLSYTVQGETKDLRYESLISELGVAQ